MLLVRDKFSFLYIDIWFDVTECKFIMKYFKMLVVFLPIFVADTKITFIYNFVAPLITVQCFRFSLQVKLDKNRKKIQEDFKIRV